MKEKKDQLTVVRTSDYHNGVKISPMQIREWHSQVFDKIKEGYPHYAISSGNSMVKGHRSSYENAIVILEFVNGYYQYTYPQPDEQIIKLENEKQKEIYNQAIDDAIKIITDMQSWVVDNGDERFLATHKEKSISKLKALKK